MSKTHGLIMGMTVLGMAFTATAQENGTRVTELEKQLSGIRAELNQLKSQQDASSLMDGIGNVASRLEFAGALEMEAFHAKSAGESDSDLTLATAEFTIDAAMADGINAHVGLLWEEDDTEENNLDEAYVTFGATEDQLFSMTVGKMYLPFGNLSSVFISDPLTLELAEINESAALVGYGNDFVQVTAGIFNGDADEESALENGIVSVTFSPCDYFELGAYWISDLLETDGLEDFAAALPSYDKQGGAGVFLNAKLGEVAFNAEYVTALDSIETGVGDVKPSAYNIEASLPVTDQVEVGVKYEGSDEFYADLGAAKFADEQYGLVAAYAVNDHVTVAGEYLHAEGLDDDESGELVTVQLAIAF